MSINQSFEITNDAEKIQLYFVHIYMLHGSGSLEWGENSLRETLINALNTKMKTNYTNKSMGSLFRDFYKTHSLAKPEHDNLISLTDKGFKTLYRKHYEILEYGKENQLDQFLPNWLKDYIPSKYLN